MLSADRNGALGNGIYDSNLGGATIDFGITLTPVPMSLALLLTGLPALALLRRAPNLRSFSRIWESIRFPPCFEEVIR